MTGVQDDDANNETVTVSHSVSGYDTVTSAHSVMVTVTDNDTARVSVEPTSLSPDEGGTLTYTVTLDTLPAGNVTITPSSGDSGAVGVEPASLTFTAANWNTAQTVSVTGVQDGDTDNETVTISHSVSGYDTVTSAHSVTVTVTDNDTAGVNVEPTSLSPDEGGTLTYTVTLDTLPAGNVTITPSSGDSGAVGVEPASLTFTAANWNTAQTVSVTGVQDGDTDNETVTISHSVSGYGAVTAAAAVTVTVTDDDDTPSESNLNNNTRGVTLSEATLSVNEGSMATYTVVLDTQPSGDVTVTPSRSSSNRDVTFSGALTFSVSNWDTAQTVTISAAEDDDASNDMATIGNIVSGADYDSVTAASVEVTVIDNDTRGVTLSEAALGVNEESTVTYTVTLATQPSGPVTIIPSSGDSGAVSVSPASLTFTAANWDTAQTVSVTGVQDDDTANETVTVSHSVSGYDTVTSAHSVMVTVTDNDTAGVSVEPTSVSPSEGVTLTYTVTLVTLPAGPVTITPSSGDSGAVGVEPASLTFTAANWNTAQTVSVTGVQDDDANNETVTVSHSVSGYDTVTSAHSVTVTVTDNDTARVSVAPPTLTVSEANSGVYTLVLDTLPAGSVTISPSSGDSGAVGVSPASLTFTAANWNTAQTVSVTGVQDADANNETVTVSHSVSGYDTVTSAHSVTVTVTDNDTAGVSVTPISLSPSEGVTLTYTVTLVTLPAGPVTISPTSGDSGAVGVEPASLTFTAANWNTAQTVSVMGVQDADASNETVTVSHSVSGYDTVTSAHSVTVTVTDNDTAGVSVTPTSVSPSEGMTLTYTVTLVTLPAGPVTISPSGGDSGAVGVEPASLTFTAANWNTAQTVSVTGVQDADANNETVTVSHSVSGYGSVTAHSVTVTVTDNDTAGVVVDPTSVSPSEGVTLTYIVTLVTQPAGNVTISPSSGDSGAVSVEPASLTFTAANWNTAQTVSVTGVQDADANNETVTVSHSVSGYGSVTAHSVTVTVTDSDTAGVRVEPTSVSPSEGVTLTYTVTLVTLPAGNVTISPSSGDSGAVGVEPASLTFTAANWNTAQTVSVTGVQDADANNETVTVSHSVSGYGSVTAHSVTVTVTDNDTAGVSVEPTSVSPSEGVTLTYTVTLVTLPAGNVTIIPSSGDSGALSVEPASLTFTPSNWDTAQTVSVTGVQDADAANETVTVSHSVSGYGSVTANSVTVTVTDNDTAGVKVTPISLSPVEGVTLTYTVTLVTQPAGNVTISPSSGDSGAVGVEPASLTFTAANWDTAQTVSVMGVQDADASNETVTVSHSVSGYGSVTANSVTVTVTDNDTAGVNVTPISLSPSEGVTLTYTVTLITQPAGNVTISPSSGDSDAVSVEPASLTFTPSNWDTAQTVSVTGVQDADTANETVTVSHSVSGYSSVTSAAAVTVTVTDNDTAGVSVEPASLSPVEGVTLTYTVTLVTLPSGNVTISPSSGDSDAVSVEPASLTFTPSNWDTPQTVSVMAEQDADTANETVTVSHSVSGYGSVTANSVTVTVTDNDTAGVNVTPISLSPVEGVTLTYSVTLVTLPAGNVTITPSSGDGDAVSVEPASLTFTPSNWDTPQTVSVMAEQDADTANETVTVSHSVSGYGSVTANSVTVTVTDNDTAGVKVTPASLSPVEGVTLTYTVTLVTLPAGNVTISPSSGDSDAVSVEPASLTFTPSNWDTAQTVSVTGVQDADTANETVTVSHSVSGYGSVTSAAAVTVTVTDNDTAGVNVTPISLSPVEGVTLTYSVTLVTLPAGNVTITPSSGDGDAVSVEPASLTFTPSNWDTPQTVSVMAEQDADTANETVTVSHSVSGYGSVTANSVTVTVTDNDTAGVKVTPASLSPVEGVTLTYTVTLVTLPAGNVTISPSSGDSDAVSVEPASLTFTPSNWDTAQTVSVTGVQDADTANETVTVSHSVSGYGSVTANSVTVTVTDNDTAGVSVEPTSLSPSEGVTLTYTMTLVTLPSGNVTITPSSGDSGALSVEPASLTFTPSNWDTPQTVSVTGVQDADTANETVTVSHSVSGYGSVTANSVTVTVTDNDTAGVKVTPISLSPSEGVTLAYTVTLVTLPAGNVTINPSSSDSGAVSVLPASLTFTAANWNTPQTVSVTGVQDDDASNETVTVSHSVSGYGAVTTAAAVMVAVTDDDDAPSESNLNNNTPGVTLSESTLSVNEGSTVTYTMTLVTLPAGNVTISPSSGDSDALSVEPASLTFTPSNWDTAQTVSVMAEQDADTANETITVSHSVSGYGSVTANSVTVTVTDNDTAGVSVEPASLSPSEGVTLTYTVTLVTLPSGNVTITPSSSDSGAVSVEPASLTFTPSNWDTPQTVSVTGVQDADTANETVTVSHSVSGYGSVTTAAAVMVAVTDDDDAPSEFTLSFNTPGVTLSESTLSVNEGSTVSYTVTLVTLPAGNVTITPSSGNSGAVSVEPASLTFTPSNWDTAQTVSVTAEQDADTANETVTVSHSVSGYGSVTTAAAVMVAVTDDDDAPSEFTLSFNTPGVTLSESTLSVNEGSTVSYTVTLVTLPAGNVTITPSSGDSDAVSVEPASLTFTPSNWNTPQTVSVTGVQDDDASNETVTVSHSVSGYGTVTTAAAVMVAVTDDDDAPSEFTLSFNTPGITLSESTLNINEGSTVTYTVVLDTRPSGNVTVTPSSSGDADVTVSDALTFSNSNWNIPQTVTVSAAEDSDASNDAATITHAVSGAGYDSVPAASVQVTVIDNDTRGITISESTLNIDEGSTVTYTVVLDTQPTSDVTVTPSSSGDADVTVSDALTFSNSNWNTPQTVTVGAAEDSDASNDAATITHAVSGADYDSVTVASVDVTVIDNDTPGVTLSEGTLSLNEGSTVTYTVVLDTQPTSDVTVTPSRSGDVDVTVSSALTFSNSNWNTPQTVTVSAAEDSDASNDDATISHAVSGADYDSVPAASVQVTVIDNEKASTVLTLKVDPAIVQEEDGNRVVTLTGTLNEAPWATDIDVLVTVGASGDGAIEGLDYSQVDNLTLTIAAGETVGTTTFSLTLLDDSIDEHDETILVAGNSSALQVIPTTITIRNNDPMPQGWLSRFGRTVADQVLDAVAGRLEASRHMGIDVQLAGQKLGTRFTEDHLQRLWSQKITEEDVLTDSSFNLTTGTEETGFAGLWGHGSISHFRGREDHVSLDGEVLSGMLGMDWTHGSTAAGLLLSHASGQGHFRSSVDTGTVAANLTGLYPYAHYAFNEQLAVAGLLGYGQGDYTLTQKQMSPIESDLSLVMASLSGRGLLVKPSVDDELEIALKTDMLVVHLSSEEVSGMFKGAEALVTRLRLGLDGSRLVQLDNGHLLTPTFEIGLRRDGGDAETGFGADIGMGLAWSNPNLGIASDIRGRALLTHTAEGFHEKGLALNFSYDPTPSSEHGFSLSLGQTMGAAATGGMDALLSPVTLEALDSPTDDGRQQFEARLAYGFPILSDAFYMTPSLGFARSPQNRTYGLGLMFSSSATHPQATDLEISLEGERREPANPDDTPEHSLELRFLFPLGGTP